MVDVTRNTAASMLQSWPPRDENHERHMDISSAIYRQLFLIFRFYMLKDNLLIQVDLC